MKYQVGDKVHYRVYPSGEPDTREVGEVVRVGRRKHRACDVPGAWSVAYYVYWRDIDRAKYAPTPYAASDLAPADAAVK